MISDSSSINANHLGMQINEEQNDGWYNFLTFESFTESVWQWENGKYTLKERIENK